ncbi:MAG: superoxide dismutase family protein [Polymorphobacter sp.]
MRKVLMVVALVMVAACTAPHPDRVSNKPPSLTTTVQLLGPNGELHGTATLSQTGSATRIQAVVSGLAPGSYAIHLHAVGKCEAPGFTTAGPHFNPTTHQHGTANPAGPHLGDLPNVAVGADGTGRIDALIAALQIRGGAVPLIDADGAAIVVHAGPDDYKTDPSGNSGARIACGALVAVPAG